MAFILWKAFKAQRISVKGLTYTILAIAATVLMVITPVTASPRDSDQAEAANCPCKAQRRLVRPLTESMPVRKKDKDRIRRILM